MNCKEDCSIENKVLIRPTMLGWETSECIWLQANFYWFTDVSKLDLVGYKYHLIIYITIPLSDREELKNTFFLYIIIHI